MPMQAGLVTNSSSLKTPAHTRRFGFDLQWDAICVKLCQHSYRKPREQDSFSSHCDCDKKKEDESTGPSPHNEHLKRRRAF
ncbi:hypothetical protein PRIPAC_98124 [Pristionchus pacificus]|uniref:Uncharacterized protein n=1 Tax=Pristionchus pacificus TaxID=54126 RepID=A0A2A6BYX1_PRIPA|nr:hypothetical protein PRIPAC_98124 [Pristionchus pacificus]|eukprot:PDM71115.1 hypothetical protein PRIPAC_38502 [Pristionchus pacificus]